MNIPIEITTGIFGVVTAVAGSVTGYLVSKKKYNSEVDNNLIKNMQESLDFYKQLADDNKKRLEEITTDNEELRQEIRDLRNQMFTIMTQICTDLSCKLRKSYNGEIKSIPV